MERIELCSNRCCPTLSKMGDLWFINDDYGGEVRLTTSQLETLVKVKLDYEKEVLSVRITESEKAEKDGLFIQS